MHQRAARRAPREHRDGIGVSHTSELVALSREPPNVVS
jgi:hypothetical protein